MRMGRAVMPSITGGYRIALTVSDADGAWSGYGSLLNMQWQKELSSRGITYTPITGDGH